MFRSNLLGCGFLLTGYQFCVSPHNSRCAISRGNSVANRTVCHIGILHLLDNRRGKRVKIVFANKYNRQILYGGKVNGRVKIRPAGAALAHKSHRYLVRFAQFCRQSDARRYRQRAGHNRAGEQNALFRGGFSLFAAGVWRWKTMESFSGNCKIWNYTLTLCQ